MLNTSLEKNCVKALTHKVVMPAVLLATYTNKRNTGKGLYALSF